MLAGAITSAANLVERTCNWSFLFGESRSPPLRKTIPRLDSVLDVGLWPGICYRPREEGRERIITFRDYSR